MDSESEAEGEPDKDSEPATRATMEIDFTPPFKRLPILETLEECLGEKLPDVNSNGERSLPFVVRCIHRLTHELVHMVDAGRLDPRAAGAVQAAPGGLSRAAHVHAPGGQAHRALRGAAVRPPNVPVQPPGVHEPSGQGAPIAARCDGALRVVCGRQGAVQRLHGTQRPVRPAPTVRRAAAGACTFIPSASRGATDHSVSARMRMIRWRHRTSSVETQKRTARTRTFVWRSSTGCHPRAALASASTDSSCCSRAMRTSGYVHRTLHARGSRVDALAPGGVDRP
jgi:hypothetical protein